MNPPTTAASHLQGPTSSSNQWAAIWLATTLPWPYPCPQTRAEPRAHWQFLRLCIHNERAPGEGTRSTSGPGNSPVFLGIPRIVQNSFQQGARRVRTKKKPPNSYHLQNSDNMHAHVRQLGEKLTVSSIFNTMSGVGIGTTTAQGKMSLLEEVGGGQLRWSPMPGGACYSQGGPEPRGRLVVKRERIIQ